MPTEKQRLTPNLPWSDRHGNFVWLSRSAEKRLDRVQRIAYLNALDIADGLKRVEQDEAYELSNERLRDRLDEMEKRLSELEKANGR